MPRASQMPRTRAVRVLLATVSLGALALVAAAGAVAKAAGSHWLPTLAGFVALVVVVVLVARLLLTLVDRAAPAAYAKDLAALSAEDRTLPFGVVAGADGDLLLPCKVSVAVLVWLVTLGLVVGGVAVALVDDPAARVGGIALVLVGLWMGVLAFWVSGTRIRLTSEGIDSRMGPHRFHRWIEVPEVKVDRQIVILKAAGGARRPRVWIRVGLLEVSVQDCVAMIRRQRDW